MSLAEIETAVIEYLGARLADCLEWDAETAQALRVLRYHGARSVPPECCGEPGLLVSAWEDVTLSGNLGAKTSVRPGQQGLLAATLAVRFYTCWPSPEPTEHGPTLVDDEWDERAAYLADVAECLARGLVCLTPGGPATEILSTVGCGGLSLATVVPIEPLSGCAGVLTRSVATLLAGATLP